MPAVRQANEADMPSARGNGLLGVIDSCIWRFCYGLLVIRIGLDHEAVATG